MLLETRFFTLRPGTRDEFDRVSREGTIPMMRRLGITVLAFGPTTNEDNGYLLVRCFSSEDERITLSQSLYADPEWERSYDGPVSSMIEDYRTAVVPITADAMKNLV